MQISAAPPTIKNPPEHFTGDVWLDPITSPVEADQRMNVALVRFAPGARTAWHTHPRGQTLHITHGTALVQAAGAAIQEVTPGQTVYIPPGELHWHGAAPDQFMEHLAMQEDGDDGKGPATWYEHVTDAEYNAR